MDEELRAYGSGLKGGQGLRTLQWGSATSCPTRKTDQMRPSIDRQEQPHIHRLLMGDFNHPNTCRRDNPAWHKQCRRFLECVDNPLFTKKYMSLQTGILFTFDFPDTAKLQEKTISHFLTSVMPK